MWYSRDVRREDLAGRNCAKCCFSKILWLRWLGKSAPIRTGGCGGSAAENAAKFAPRLRAAAIWKSKSLKTGKICTAPARDSDLELKIVKNWYVRSTFGSWRRQNLHHACARERFGSCSRLNLHHACARERFGSVKIVKTPGSRTSFWGSKCFSRGRRRDFDTFQKCVAGAGVREGCKNVGRRGGFEEAPKQCISRGRRKDFVLCDVDVWRLRRWIRGRVANFMSRKCYFAGIILRGSYRSSYASAPLFPGRRSTFEAST